MKAINKSSTAEQVVEGMNLAGLTVLITGCTSGIGLETMRVLALKGARVLGAGRTTDKASKACANIKGDTVPLVCDLSNPTSIQQTIKYVKEPVDVIIANAGVMALQDRVIQNGVEAHMFTNHVGHFMLVNGLLDRLTRNGRIVIVSSAAHSYVRGKGLELNDWGWNRPYKPWVAYGHSKLANILFAKELAKRLSKGQTANALHPGIVDTSLWRHVPNESSKYNLKTVEQGTATSAFLAVHPSVATVSGEYFSNCKIGKPSAFAQDANLAIQLWEATEDLVANL